MQSMSRIFSICLLWSLVLFSSLKICFSQPSVPGKYHRYLHEKSLRGPPVQEIVMPEFDNQLLQAVEMAKLGKTIPSSGPHSMSTRKSGPFKFGHHVDIGSVDIAHNGTWLTLSKEIGRVWKLKITSPTALSLNLVFEEFQLPVGAELYIHGEQRVLGAYTAELNNKPHKKFTTAPLLGKSIMIEYFEPSKVSQPALLKIQSVVHGFDNPYGQAVPKKYSPQSNISDEPKPYESNDDSNDDAIEKRRSGQCEVNVACPHATQWVPATGTCPHQDI